ncbi:MAG: hypothetical protein H6838_16580 [Planctomycetes bacterium]|nr:hypothetical protein [Planctomycetota bacterium]
MTAAKPPVPPSPPSRPRPVGSTNVEHTKWSPGLIGFYLSCAGVALGATFAASGHFFFGNDVWLLVGGLLSVVSCVTCYYSLRAARRAPGSRPE